MRKASFLFLLLITLTGCSDTMAYSPGGEPPLARCFLCTSCKRKQDIFNKTDSLIMLQPETATSTESTPETVPESSPAAIESETTTQTCAASAEPAESIIITEAKEAETTQETAVYTETTAVQETTVQTTIPPETTTISTTTTTPESTTQTTTEPPQIVDMNALSPQMWVFLTEYGIDHDTLYMKGQGYSGSDLDRAAAALADANAIGGRNCIEYALNAYFLYDGAGLDCGIAFASYDGWYGHVVNIVKIDGIWREFDASAGKYADNTTSIIEAFDLYENRIQLN